MIHLELPSAFTQAVGLPAVHEHAARSAPDQLEIRPAPVSRNIEMTAADAHKARNKRRSGVLRAAIRAQGDDRGRRYSPRMM